MRESLQGWAGLHLRILSYRRGDSGAIPSALGVEEWRVWAARTYALEVRDLGSICPLFRQIAAERRWMTAAGLAALAIERAREDDRWRALAEHWSIIFAAVHAEAPMPPEVDARTRGRVEELRSLAAATSITLGRTGGATADD